MKLPIRPNTKSPTLIDAIIYLLAAISVSDRKLTKEEVATMHNIAREYGYTEEYTNKVLKEAIKSRKESPEEIKSCVKESVEILKSAPEITKVHVFDLVYSIIIADGEVSKSEQQIFDFIQENLNYDS